MRCSYRKGNNFWKQQNYKILNYFHGREVEIKREVYQNPNKIPKKELKNFTEGWKLKPYSSSTLRWVYISKCTIFQMVTNQVYTYIIVHPNLYIEVYRLLVYTQYRYNDMRNSRLFSAKPVHWGFNILLYIHIRYTEPFKVLINSKKYILVSQLVYSDTTDTLM